MAFHHVAIATRDLDATHEFYTEAMGFRLVKAVVAPTPHGGWARHLFYDTGGPGLLAFWDLHGDARVPEEFSPAISVGLGLPPWVNHLAFDAENLGGIEKARLRWLEHGHDVFEIDHGWCTSVYATDPNDILVEFCATTIPFTGDDGRRAEELRLAARPPLEEPPPARLHRARSASVPAR